VQSRKLTIRKRWVEFFPRALSEMDYDSPLWKVVKQEMERRGNWKNRPRGKPFNGQRRQEADWQ
jgi:hypothetical protein